MKDEDLRRLIEVVEAEIRSATADGDTEQADQCISILHGLVNTPCSGSDVKLGGQLFLNAWAPDQKLMRPVKNIAGENSLLHEKPGGGLWTSSYVNNSSDWVKVANRIGVGTKNKRWWLLQPEPCRVMVIDSVEDLAQLPKMHCGNHPYNLQVDWELVAQHWDAVHLTKCGQLESHTSWPMNLWGWDCECTFWCRWQFESVSLIR